MKSKLVRTGPSVLLIISFFLLLITGCQKNSGGGGGNPPGEEPVNDDVKLTASIRGIVVDETNKPVSGATVKSGTVTTLTDQNGVFRFYNISMSASNAYVKVERSGYFNAGRSFIAISGRTHNIRIRLIPKTNAGNFVGATGGSISLAGGGKLTVPAASIIDVGGNDYVGTVNVAMTWIDPTSPNLPSLVPGDLRGLTTTGVERGLQTFGMLGVEMTGGSGQVLRLANGKTAELSFPIPASLSASAPATIQLWHFDDITGRWKEEGTATKTGSNYIATVSHFSFWNCDAPFPLATVCMQLFKSQSLEPFNGATVRIRRTSNNSFTYGYTDSIGNICGAVPRDEPLVLELLDQCSNVIYSQNIGPFSNATDIGVITVNVPAASNIYVTGVVKDCNNAIVINGSVYLNLSTGYSYAAPVRNGNFAITLLNCSGNTVSISATAVDYNTQKQSTPSTFTQASGSLDMGTLQACGSSASEYATVNIDGTLLSFVLPTDSLIAYSTADTGTYSLRTSIYAMRRTPNGNQMSVSFRNNPAPGTYPILSCYVDGGALGTAQEVLSSSPTITLTEYGAIGSGFLQGTFNLQMNFSGTPRNVSVSFKTRRIN